MRGRRDRVRVKEFRPARVTNGADRGESLLTTADVKAVQSEPA